MKILLKTALLGSIALSVTACTQPKQTKLDSSMNTQEPQIQNSNSEAAKPFTRTVKMKNIYSDQELITLLKKHSYHSAELLEPKVIRIVINNEIFLLDNGTKERKKLSLDYYLDNDINITLNTINKWNKSKNMKAVMRKNTNDILFTLELHTDKGISESQILKMLRIGEYSMDYLSDFLDEQEK